MPSRSEALKKAPSSVSERDLSPHFEIIPPTLKPEFNWFGSVITQGSERLRAGLRKRPDSPNGRHLQDYSDIELKAAIRSAQRTFRNNSL